MAFCATSAAMLSSYNRPASLRPKLPAIEVKGLLRLALAEFAGGLAWAAIPAAAATAFPFMRAGRAWPGLVIAGGLTGALCVSLLEILGQWGFGAVYIVLWGVWYAVQGGLIAMALPGEGDGT